MDGEITKGEAIAQEYKEEAVMVTQADMNRYGIKDPEQIVKMAKEVAKYVESNSLSTEIQGSRYVLIEGWQFAAGLLGLVGRISGYSNASTYKPVTFKWKVWDRQKRAYTEKSKSTKEYRYFADAEFVKHGPNGEETVVARASALCSNEEQKKHTFDEYSILSMAQTRALGKAARMALAFLVKAAGYAPTPAEEMEGVVEEQEKKPEKVELPADLTEKIAAFTDHNELVNWAGDQTDYAKNMDFRKSVMKKKTELLQKLADGTK